MDESSPGTHFVEYADGTFAEYLKKKIEVEDNGVKKWRLWLKPGKDIIEAHDLKYGEEMDRYGVIGKVYDYNDVHIIRDDPTYGRIWVETDFNGNPTEMSLRYQNYKEQIKNYQKETTTLKAMVAAAHEEMQKIMASKKEWMKEVVGVVQEALVVRKRTREDDQGDMDMGEQV